MSFTSTVTEWISDTDLEKTMISARNQMRAVFYGRINKHKLLLMWGRIMYCEQCGSLIENGEAFCSNCGAPAPSSKAASEPAPGPVVQPIMQADIQPIKPAYEQPQPVYQPQPAQPLYPQPAYQQPAYQSVITPFETKKSNVFAVLGLIFGIITAVFSWLILFNMIPGIAGIVLSVIGLTQKNAGKKGMATAGLITSIAGILIGFMILGLAVMSDA